MPSVKGKKIGFIGLGSMGKPMALNVLKAGFPLTVYDIRPEPLKELAKAGAKIARSARELGGQSDTVVVMVVNYPQLKEAVFPPGGVLSGMKKGSTLIITSTIAPRQVLEVAKAASEVGVNVIDSPVSGGSIRAAEGNLSLMVGADARTLKSNEGLLKAMGKNIYHVGKVGQGQAMKMINQLCYTTNLVGVAESLVLARKLNLDLPLVVDIVSHSAGDSFAMKTAAPRMLAGNFEGGGAISILTKDTRIIIDTSMESELTFLMPGVCHNVFRIADSRGIGKEDSAAIVKIFEEYAGVKVSDSRSKKTSGNLF